MSNKSTKEKRTKVSANGRPTAFDREQHQAICEVFGISPSDKEEVTAVDHVLELQSDLDSLVDQNIGLLMRLRKEAMGFDAERRIYEAKISALRELVNKALESRNRGEAAQIDMQVQLAAAAAT